MKAIHTGLLFAVILTIPLHQLLYVSLGGVTVKAYQLLLIALTATSLLQSRESQPLSYWQKLGLAFFLASICGEIVGYIELVNFGKLPELNNLGTVESYRGFINFYLLLNMIFAVQVAKHISEERHGFRDVVTVAAFGSVFPALYAIYQLTSFVFGFQIDVLEFNRILDRPDAERGIFTENGMFRFASTYFEPGPYGGYLSVIIPLTLCAISLHESLTDNSRHWQGLTLKGALALNIVAFFLSFSTSAVVGMGLFTALVIWLNYPLSKILKIIGGIIFFISVVLTVLDLWEFVFSVFDSFLFRKLFADESDDLSGSRLARIYQTEIGLKIFLDHPIIGIGPYVPFFFEIYSPSVGGMAQGVSIVYTNVLVQTGVIGFTLFATALVKMFFELIRRSLSSLLTRNQYGVFLLGLFVSILILFFTLGSIVAIHLWLAFGVIIGFIESTSPLKATPQTST